MADVCPDCGRPSERGDHEGMSWCILRGSHSCEIVRAAYRRGRRDGIDEGVAIAKREARLHEGHVDPLCMASEIEWDDVDAAAAKAKGE